MLSWQTDVSSYKELRYDTILRLSLLWQVYKNDKMTNDKMGNNFVTAALSIAVQIVGNQ